MLIQASGTFFQVFALKMRGFWLSLVYFDIFGVSVLK